LKTFALGVIQSDLTLAEDSEKLTARTTTQNGEGELETLAAVVHWQ